MTANWIRIKDLIVGGVYACDARNFTYGTWNGEEFEYIRTKFGQTFTDTELHYDAHETHGTVKPLRLAADE